MEYRHVVIADKPSAAWTFDAGTFKDYSGFGLNSLTTPDRGGTILANSIDKAAAVTSGSTLSLPVDLMDPGRERQTFTLEAWFRPENVTAEVVVLGRPGARDGITYDGTSIHFVTKYGTAGEARATYTPETKNTVFYAVGIHDSERNLLMVNNQVVASVDLTDAQKADTYTTATTASRLSPGNSASGSGTLLVDGLAVYDFALGPEAIRRHYFYGKYTSDPMINSLINGGRYWNLSDVASDIALSLLFQQDAWDGATVLDVTDRTGNLENLRDDIGATLGGFWTYGTLLSGTGSISGSKVEWEGAGAFTVQTSIDAGATWQNVTNGGFITGISAGFTPTDTSTLSVRVVFPAGVTTPIYVSRIGVTLYKTGDRPSSNGTQFLQTVGNVTYPPVHSPILNRTAMSGVRYLGGRTVITAYNVADTAATTQSIEMWVSVTPGAAMTIIDAGAGVNLRWTGTAWAASGMTVVVDGAVPGTLSLSSGRLYHIVARLNAATANAITIGSTLTGTEPATMTLFWLATYPTALTDAQAFDLRLTHLGFRSAAITEPSVFTATDTNNPPQTFSFIWT